nr:hypothetical protein Iba_chr10cCG3090 [Ipomoea batatas]
MHHYPSKIIRHGRSDCPRMTKRVAATRLTIFHQHRLLKIPATRPRPGLRRRGFGGDGFVVVVIEAGNVVVRDWECLDRSSSELLATSIPQKSPSRLRNCWIEDEEEWNRDSDDDCREWNGGFDLQARGLD